MHNLIEVSSNGYIDIDASPPGEGISDLEDLLASFNLPHGISNSRASKLQEALAAPAIGDTVGACSALQAFLNQVRAQEGKKLTAQEAQQLIDSAVAIRTQIGC